VHTNNEQVSRLDFLFQNAGGGDGMEIRDGKGRKREKEGEE